MTPFPLPLDQLFGHYGQYIVYLIIGIAFGVSLELAGFAQSTKLAAQFYFKEMTVLKVMFTGIVVAMLGVFLATGLGLLDYNLVYVNPTYLWPGIVGGLVMGVGFIVGGFCPGTSLVAAATLKIDGIIFALGAFFGIFVFGETVGLYEDFWYSSYMGRFTLMDLFQTSTGVIVLAVVIMALGAFLMAEFSEQIFGKSLISRQPRWRVGAAAGALALGIGVLAIGQPDNAARWRMLEAEKQPLLDSRAVYIHPGEVLQLMNDRRAQAILLDVRDEADFNLFHIRDARNVQMDELIPLAVDLREEPANTVFFVMSNDEQRATEAWKILVAESLINVYIVEGGVNNWLDTFAEADFKTANLLTDVQSDSLHYTFASALGERSTASAPNPDAFEALVFEPKVQLVGKRGASGGGCG
ncbi:MAG: YeeE/YedE family protein [Anaerolineae bacterium]|nr:YeeE/YedE family protein [Anaerolineae bacterium]